MAHSKAKPRLAVGFLTVVEHEPHGLFGGYLVLNETGRPLEFHCTAPVKPNRAQQILYGRTLIPFLYGEQIGQTLVSAAKTKVLAVCTDLPDALCLADHVEIPVAWVTLQDDETRHAAEPANGDEAGEPSLRIDAGHAGPPAMTWLELGRHRLAVPERRAADWRSLEGELRALSETVDLAEPFQRIRAAIEEAQRGGR